MVPVGPGDAHQRTVVSQQAEVDTPAVDADAVQRTFDPLERSDDEIEDPGGVPGYAVGKQERVVGLPAHLGHSQAGGAALPDEGPSAFGAQAHGHGAPHALRPTRRPPPPPRPPPDPPPPPPP